MFEKKVFVRNFYEAIGSMKQKEVAGIMGCTESTLSRYLNPAMDNMPSVEQIVRLTDYLHISIDWLVGNSTDDSTQRKELSPRDICKALSAALNLSGATFKDVDIEECCQYVYEDEPSKMINNYHALYFSEWEQGDHDIWDNDFDPDTLFRRLSINEAINHFIERLMKIYEMKKNGDLDQEMYDILLDKYLSDVPDK